MNITRTHRCPHCKKAAAWEGNPFRPFCSERCKLIDLGDWASERYRIPGEPAAPEAPEVEDGEDEKESQ
ncbi:MAG: DNA gyrase inhibitor YacG [Pseudomonadota bacterium]